MKKALVISLLTVAALSLAAFAGPFVGFDYTVPEDGTLYFGWNGDPWTLEWSVSDLFLVPPVLGFSAEYLAEFPGWDSKVWSWIEEIDFISTYPTPKVKGMGVAWRGTLHMGDVWVLLAESAQTLATSTFDAYGEASFEYKHSGRQLVPTGSLGFYWELW